MKHQQKNKNRRFNKLPSRFYLKNCKIDLEAIIPSRSNLYSELTTKINTENNSLLILNERNTLISPLCTLFTIAICTCEIGSLPLTMADFGVVFLGAWFIFACLMLTLSWEAPNKPTLDYIQNNPIYGGTTCSDGASMLILFYCLTSLRFHIRVIFALYYYYYHYYYSGTCLIRHTKRPGKCVRLDRMSEYSVLF